MRYISGSYAQEGCTNNVWNVSVRSLSQKIIEKIGVSCQFELHHDSSDTKLPILQTNFD